MNNFLTICFYYFPGLGSPSLQSDLAGTSQGELLTLPVNFLHFLFILQIKSQHITYLYIQHPYNYS